MRRAACGIAVAALAACGGGGGGSGTTQREGYAVDVTLLDFSISPGRTSVPGGKITFVVANRGPDNAHEFLLLRTDLAADKLPTNADGSVNETGEGITAVTEIETFPAGEIKETTVDLSAGKYVFVCNVVDAASTPAKVHYVLGMRAAFAAT